MSILGFLHWIAKCSLCTFFNLTKAFDSLSHKPLLHSLSLLNLPPLCLSWLHSYLQGHTQQVIINGSLSSKSQVTSGVPQGFILRPLLFIIYINDIGKLSLPSSATITLYAGDILLSQEISFPTSMSPVTTSTLTLPNTTERAVELASEEGEKEVKDRNNPKSTDSSPCTPGSNPAQESGECYCCSTDRFPWCNLASTESAMRGCLHFHAMLIT